MELRRRYNNLYVPPYFFYSRIRWSESFPCHAPFSIKKPSSFHIFHKSVDNPNGADNGAIFDAPDADDSFSAKVRLHLNYSYLFINYLIYLNFFSVPFSNQKGNVDECATDY